MTDLGDPAPPIPPEQAAETGTLVTRISLRQRSGGVIVPVFTAVLAFLIGGAVVAATGHNPLTTYRDIFNGAGLNWFFHPTTDTAGTASYNLSQTLLQTTSLILTGLAVGVCVPLRPLQHRRAGPVLRRPVRRELDRRVVGVDGGRAAHPDRDPRCGCCGRGCGRGSPAS